MSSAAKESMSRLVLYMSCQAVTIFPRILSEGASTPAGIIDGEQLYLWISCQCPFWHSFDCGRPLNIDTRRKIMARTQYVTDLTAKRTGAAKGKTEDWHEETLEIAHLHALHFFNSFISTSRLQLKHIAVCIVDDDASS